MKIARLVTRLLECELGGNVWNASQRWRTKHIVLVFLETDDGHLGVGEGWTTGASAAALVRTIEDDLGPLVLGADPLDRARIWDDAWRTTALSARRGITAAALGAVDTALWDLAAQAAGMALHRLLGTRRERVFCYASAGLYGRDKGPDRLAAEMAGYAERGFTAFKIKVGGAPVAEDVARVAAVREAIGPAARLMIDCNYMLDVPQALRLARAVEPYDVYFLEAPVAPDDVAGQATVAARSPLPVCGNETEHGADRFRELVLTRAVEYVQLDVAACGGVTEGLRIGALASVFHRPVTLHASSSSVLLAATLHLAAALPGLDSVEYHMLHQWLWDDLPEGTFAVEPGGWVRPPAGPGLGITLDPDGLPAVHRASTPGAR